MGVDDNSSTPIIGERHVTRRITTHYRYSSPPCSFCWLRQSLACTRKSH